MFQAHVRNRRTTPSPFRGTAAALDELRESNRALQAHSAELEQKIKVYANVIQIMAMERAAGATG
jgi:hypothetical protein